MRSKDYLAGTAPEEWIPLRTADFYRELNIELVVNDPVATLDSRQLRIEHWVVAQSQGQAVARAMLGQTGPFRAVPFFWSNHHDVALGYIGHVERWDRMVVHGSLEARDACVVYWEAGRIGAVATVGRDRVRLLAEAAMERGDERALELIVSGA